MPASKTTLRNSLPHDVSAVATIAPRWAFADAGVSAAAILIPLGGGVYTAWKAEQTIRSMLVARRVWALVITGRKIAKDVASQVSKAGTAIVPGGSVEIHKMGTVHRWTTPSGIASRFGATAVKVVVSDEVTARIVAFKCAPGTRWTIGEQGVTSRDGTTYPWMLEVELRDGTRRRFRVRGHAGRYSRKMSTRVADGRLPRFLRNFALRPTTAPMAAGAAPLIAAHLEAFPRADARTLLRAYELAEKCHRGQMRKSGEPYVTHPLAVATVLAMVGMDTDTVAAAVLHDTVEDTDLTLYEVAAGFGPGVAALVDGVTKLDGSRWGKAAAEAETYRKMIVAADDDLRVLVIKIADRLHNLRTIGGHPKVEKRQSVARQSMQLLVPLARRLGLYVFVREMEDLALAALEPRAYERVVALIRSTAAERASEMERVAEDLRQALAAERLPARVVVRSRHLSSVRQALGDAVNDEEQALTLRAGEAERIAVVVDGPPESCYAALGVLHGRWIPETSRFRDYIAMPQHNLYRALHTSLHVGNGISASVMIRTPEMDRIAEYGIAAQIRATAGKTGRASQEAVHRADLEWLQSILGWQRLSESSQFLADARADLGSGGIVTFTPSGTMVRLPKGATGLDFAYAIGPETGNDAAGVTVDGKLQPLAAPLRDGQVVEVIPAAYPDQPEESWLDSALTAQARTHIRSAIALRRAEEAADAGREEVKVLADALGLDLFDLEIDGTALQAGRRLGYPDLDALYIAVAGDRVGPDKVAGLLSGEDVAAPAREDAPAG